MPRRARPSAWSVGSRQVLTGPYRFRKGVSIVLGALAAIAAVVVIALRSPSLSNQNATVAETQPQASTGSSDVQPPRPLRAAETPSKAAPAPQATAEKPATREEVEKLVATKNAEERKELQKFEAEGWTPVAAPSPDLPLLSLDPRLLPTREKELRKQLETNSLQDDQLDNAMVIATDAEEPRTRTAAIQAIGRSNSERAKELVLQLFDEVEDDNDRRLVLGYVRPESLDDPSVNWLISKLGEPHLADDFKKQMTFSLVLAEIAQAGENHEHDLPKLLERVPEAWRQQVLDSYHTITRED